MGRVCAHAAGATRVSLTDAAARNRPFVTFANPHSGGYMPQTSAALDWPGFRYWTRTTQSVRSQSFSPCRWMGVERVWIRRSVGRHAVIPGCLFVGSPASPVSAHHTIPILRIFIPFERSENALSCRVALEPPRWRRSMRDHVVLSSGTPCPSECGTSAGQLGPCRQYRPGQAGPLPGPRCGVAAPMMAVVDGLLTVELAVGLPGQLSLTSGGRDLDNYLFPLAQRLDPARIAAMFGP